MQNIEEVWKEKFSAFAKAGGNDYQLSQWSESGLKNYIKYFFEYFPEKNIRNSLALDVGCGPGTFSRLLVKRGFKVCAVDFSEEMVRAAKERTEDKSIDYRTAEVCKLPFFDNYFDVVICSGVFQHVYDYKKALREMRRVLKNKGLLVITTLNSLSADSLFFKNELRRYNPYDMKKNMAVENFSGVEIKGIYFSPFAPDFFTDFVLKSKIYRFFNFLFPVFCFFSHSFYIEGRKNI